MDDLIAFAAAEVPAVSGIDALGLGESAVFAEYPAEPHLTLGFNHWIHKGKGNSSVLAEAANVKHKEVVNAFEHRVTGYEGDIQTTTREYFGLGKSEHIVSRAFYKLWEMLMAFDLADARRPITALHLAEAPGAFIQATMLYRGAVASKKNGGADRHVACSLREGAEAQEGGAAAKKKGRVPAFDDSIAASKKLEVWCHKDSDLNDPEVQEELAKNALVANKVDLVTADGGFNWKDENYQEQEAQTLLVSQMLAALTAQAEGGAFVLKLFETFTTTTLKLVGLLTRYYGRVHLFKPLTSRASNSERYLVCLDFRGIRDRELEALRDLHRRCHENRDKFLQSLAPELDLPGEYVGVFRRMGIELANRQYRQINEALTYVQGGNYFGAAYHAYVDAQKAANAAWIGAFYPAAKGDASFRAAKKRLQERVRREEKAFDERVRRAAAMMEA